MSTEPFFATRLSVLTAKADYPHVYGANQFRGDQRKKKGKNKAAGRAVLVFRIIPLVLVANRLQTRAHIGCRQGDPKCRASSGRAFDADVSGMLLNNAV